VDLAAKAGCHKSVALGAGGARVGVRNGLLARQLRAS